MKQKYILIILLLVNCISKSQNFTDSNLPIVVITTDLNTTTNLPLEIEDVNRVLGSMKIIKHSDGSRNFLTDINTIGFLNYNGRINIETRGSSSQSLPKKSYSLTTLLANNINNNNVSLLGMPSENDWILNSLAFDPSLIRDYLAYNLSRQMGNYATRTQYCEVVVNGEYRGLYLLQEKVKADSNRVDVTKITTSDLTSPNLSGGYITRADRGTVAWSTVNYLAQNTNYVHELPSPTNVLPAQNNYIHSQFEDLQTAITANNASLLNGYTTIIDIPTFVDFMVSNEFAANVDGYQLSTYFHKDRNGKLRAGPIWDFNLTLGNDLFAWGYNRSFINTWQFSNGDNEGSKFWTDLYANPEFKCYFSKRFHDLIQPGQPMNETVRNAFIDNTILLLGEAMVRENQKWNTIPNNPLEISTLKTWMNDRTTWMTTNLGSYSACSNVSTPTLVISKINYNPIAITTPTAISSNDQEFIQITNTGATSVNLSGINFSKLGTTYQFPYNTSIAGNSNIYLASNSVVFQSINGFAPFGQFTRNLSNKSQNIVLADAFGNEIDRVEYFDSTPWPLAADGLGSYLQLVSTNLDNNIASSWIASTATLPNESFNLIDQNTLIYPNPASSLVEISSPIHIEKFEVIDTCGKLLKLDTVSSNKVAIDISNFSNGIYLIKIHTQFGVKTEKLIKN